MTEREKIIQIAVDTGAIPVNRVSPHLETLWWSVTVEDLERFYQAVRAEALEDAAQNLESGVLGHGECAAAIREMK